MKKNILFLENNAFMKNLVKAVFKTQHNVITSDCISDAIQIFSNVRQDLIITDLNLDGENGIDFVNKIKDLDNDVPIIILSGETDAKIQCYLLGVDDFIAKPFLIKELDLRVNNLLKRSLEYYCKEYNH
ncbi:response regulator transcription factor [Flammeovirga pacifica]|nr:response regulator [Flammeovirga pacifica]